jgi:PEP-CTERM motif
MSGTDFYNYSDVRVWINGGSGPAPRITHVFASADSNAVIPTANLIGSIWDGGDAAIFPDPDGTYPTSSGLRTAATFASAGFALQNTNGVFLTLTIDTTGVPAGVYAVSLTDHPFLGITGVFTVLSPPEPIPLEIINGTITVTPEPASLVMGLFAVAGLAAVAVRRHRARRVMAVRSRTSGPL